MRRSKIRGRGDRKRFSRTASKSNRRNFHGTVMRGGYRI